MVWSSLRCRERGRKVVCVFDAQGWVLSPAGFYFCGTGRARKKTALRDPGTGLDGWMILLGSSLHSSR